MTTYKDLLLSTTDQNTHAVSIVNLIKDKASVFKTTSMFNILSLMSLLNSPDSSKENTRLMTRLRQAATTNNKSVSKLELKEQIIKEGRSKYGMTDAQIAYVLATAWHESRFQLVKEGFYNSKIHELRKKEYYDPKTGNSYYGRGYVQVTHKYNYKKMQERLKKEGIDVDLVGNPDKALDHDIAFPILMIGMKEGLFTGFKLTDFINDKQVDFYNARKIINGLDRANLIKEHAQAFYKELTLNIPSGRI